MDVMFWVWLGVIIVTAIVEFATMEVVSIWFTIGAVIPFILAATGAVNWIWQVVIFVVLSAIMIVCLRSVTKRFLLKNSNEKTNVDSLIGQKVRMLSRTDFETVGSVKINDVVWSAIGFSQQTIEKDEIVTILSVQGNKLVVKKEEPEVVEEEKKPARKKSEKKEPKRKTNEVAAENSAEKVVTEKEAENTEKDAEKVEKKKVPAKKPSKSKTKEPKKKIAATENDTEKVEKKVSTKKPAKSKVEETKKKATTTKKTSTKTSSKSKTTSKSTKNTKNATKSAANKRS